MASTLKCDTVTTLDGAGNITFNRPIVADGSNLTNLNISALAGNKLTGEVVAKGDGSSTDGKLTLNCSQNTHGVSIQSPAHSAGASYTLTLPTTNGNASEFLQTDGSGALTWATAGGGKVLQHKIYHYKSLVSASNQFPLDNTKPQSNEGFAVTELAITPVSATSTLYIDYWVTFSRSNHDMGIMALFVDSQADCIAVSSAQGNTNMYTMQGYYSVVSGSTSARTYKLRAAASPGGAGTMYLHTAGGTSWWHAGTIPNSGIRIYEMEA